MDFRIISENSYNKSGQLIDKINCTYDNLGRLIEQNKEYGDEWWVDKVNNFTRKYLFRDYLNGSNIYSDDQQETTLFKYEKSGKLSEEVILNYNKKVFKRIKYSYDDKGNIVQKVTKYLPTGNFLWHRKEETDKYLYKYDENNNEIECRHYESKGKAKLRWVSKYDLDGNAIEINRYGSNGKLELKTQQEYEKGLVKEISAFDKNGNLKNKREFQYHYDKKGNWIKAMVIWDNDLDHYVIREIEYF